MLKELERPIQENHRLAEGNKLQLPKGGGALAGLEENLSVSQATGMLNMTIKLPFLENRHGFNPPMTLNYSSSNGNGILGMGWDLGLPAIFRKTDRRIPEYRDQDDGDTFILAGQDDLVPFLKKDANGAWTEDKSVSGSLLVRRYRPRVEKDFLKIERIQAGSQTSWKVTAGNNTVTFYGLTDEGRIFDLDDGRRVWKWLPQLRYDNLGNLMQFRYKQENLDNVGGRPSEKTHEAVQANRYLKRVLYGNSSPFYPDDANRYAPILSDDRHFFFEIVLDYGDQDDSDPYQANLAGWPTRSDSFSTFRPGFEVRTRRLVKRILFFNCFRELSDDGSAKPVPVKSVDFSYRYFGHVKLAEAHEADYLTGITESSWRRQTDGSLTMKSLPTLQLGYTEVKAAPVPGKTGVIRLDKTSLDAGYLLVDYANEGLPGILTEKPEGLYYSSNLGEGDFSQPSKLLSIPSMRGLGDRNLEIGALDPHGRKFLVTMGKAPPGFYEQDIDGLTIGFTPFKQIPNIDPNLENHCYLDLNGDGLGELAVFGDAEGLALLRQDQDIRIMESIKSIREANVEEAKKRAVSIQKSLDAARGRRTFFSGRTLTNESEKGYLNSLQSALDDIGTQKITETIASVVAAIPDFKIGAPTSVGTTFGGSNLAKATMAIASYYSGGVGQSNIEGARAAAMGGYERRMDDWKMQADSTKKEVEQLENELLITGIRKEVSERELNTHNLHIENSREILDYMTRMFTAQELYDWLTGEVSAIYFQGYQLAVRMARKAQLCYSKELNDSSASFIGFSYWDSLKKGLLAAGRLVSDINMMEAAYIENNKRKDFELTKNISLGLLDPVRLIELKSAGSARFNIPELLFDLDYPGHYLRRIKSVSVSLHCVTGPFTTVNATLRLTRHFTRTSLDTVANDFYALKPEDYQSGDIQSIATSTAQNDSGLFICNFDDDRYLPFEGCGAVSEWDVTLVTDPGLR